MRCALAREHEGGSRERSESAVGRDHDRLRLLFVLYRLDGLGFWRWLGPYGGSDAVEQTLPGEEEPRIGLPEALPIREVVVTDVAAWDGPAG